MIAEQITLDVTAIHRMLNVVLMIINFNMTSVKHYGHL